MLHQQTWAEGSDVVIRRAFGGDERHSFESAAEASARAAVIVEALTWIGTPFKNCSDIKGPDGGVDCAMLMVRANVDTGQLPAFDPRPYPPTWFLHRSEERFLGWIEDALGGVEVENPRVGDNLVYRFGNCFSHGAIMINADEVVHAFYKSRIVHVSRRDEQDLVFDEKGALRPVKAFQVRPKVTAP